MADDSDSSGTSGDHWLLPWLGVLVWLVPAVLGAAAGTAVWLVCGWPWWSLIGAVAAGPVVFLTLLYGPGIRTMQYSWPTRVLILVRPSTGLARMAAEDEKRFRSASFPFYGLSSAFAGRRRLIGPSVEGRRRHTVWRISLGHGDVYYPEKPWLVVSTAMRRPAADEARQRRRLAEWTWASSAVKPHRHAPDLEEIRRRRAEIDARPDPEWPLVDIAVDGVPVSFGSLPDADGERWAAHTVHGDVLVTLMANRMPIDSVALVTISDVQPYVDGTNRRRP